MNIFVISKELKSVKQFVVFNNIRIGCIPDIITVSNHFTEFLNDFPIIVSFKFKAVSPDIHHVKILFFSKCHELLAKINKIMIVMTGWNPAHIVFRHRKTILIPYKHRTIGISSIGFCSFSGSVFIISNSCIFDAN